MSTPPPTAELIYGLVLIAPRDRRVLVPLSCHGEAPVRSAAGVECAPTPTWPGGPKVGRRRPAHHGPPGDGDLATGRACAVLQSAHAACARGASQDRSPAPARPRRAPRALETV